MNNTLQNIVLMAGFIGIAVFLDYIIRKACDMIEYIVDEEETEPSSLVFFLSVSPYFEKISNPEEPDYKEHPISEVKEDGSDRSIDQNEGHSGSCLFVGITEQSESHPDSSPVCIGQSEDTYGFIRG